MNFSLEELFEEYKLYNLGAVENVVDYYKFDADELMVVLDDGRKVLFDNFDKTFRYIRPNTSSDTMDEEQWRIEFARRLIKKMNRRGFTQKLLAEQTGISALMIHKYVSGKSTPSIYNVEKIARALNYSVSDFLNFPTY